MRYAFYILLAMVAVGVSCSRDLHMKTYSIGSTKIDLPDFLETRVEEDTLVAFPPRTDFANIRFTVISITKDERAGERLIRNEAAENKQELHEGNGRVWYQTTEQASEGSAGSLMHYWYVGLGGHALVASCFVDATRTNDPLARRVLDSVEPAIQTFRTNLK